MKAWHFLPNDRHLQFGSRELITVGKKLETRNEIGMYDYGFSASKNILDALSYAPGSIVCRVEIGNEIIHHPDKLVASERTVLWMYDATAVLYKFACLCIRDMEPLWGTPRTATKLTNMKAPLIKKTPRATWLATRDALTIVRSTAWDNAYNTARATGSSVMDAGDAGNYARVAEERAVFKKQNKRLAKMLTAARPS